MKKIFTLLIALLGLCVWLLAQSPMATRIFSKATGRAPQAIRVGFNFGNPTKNCNGGGQICQIEQIANKSLSLPAWAEGEGTLYFTRSGHVEMDIYKTSLSEEDEAPAPFSLPVLTLEDSLYIDFVLPDAQAAYQGVIALPPGRHYVIETESRYIIQW